MNIILADERRFVENELTESNHLFSGATWFPASNLEELQALSKKATMDILVLGSEFCSRQAEEIFESFEINPLKLPTIIITKPSEEETSLHLMELGVQDCISITDFTPIRLKRSLLFAKRRSEIVSSFSQQAQTDPLTKLGNRSLLKERVELAIARANRRKNKFALFFLDLDDFKRVNDELGHQVGDALLKEVAKRLQTCLRKEDLVTRLGGDEFVLLAEEISEVKNLSVIAERVIDSINSPFHELKESSIQVGVSIGIGIFPDDGLTYEKLLESADNAMYNAKAEGKNCLSFSSANLSVQIQQYQLFVEQLKLALDRDEFHIYYQPVIDTSQQKAVSMESYIRWKTPSGHIFNASDFLNVFEEKGWMDALGKWVFCKAYHQYSVWRKYSLFSCPISFNLSEQQLDETFLIFLKDFLLETKTSPKLFLFEIKESDLSRSWEQMKHFLIKMKEMNFQLCLDNFEGGKYGLKALQELPFDQVKLSPTFVENLAYSKKDQIITKHLYAMGEELGVKVIIKGVEHRDQANSLHQHKCFLQQGFYFSAPVPIQDIDEAIMASLKNIYHEPPTRAVGGTIPSPSLDLLTPSRLLQS